MSRTAAGLFRKCRFRASRCLVILRGILWICGWQCGAIYLATNETNRALAAQAFARDAGEITRLLNQYGDTMILALTTRAHSLVDSVWPIQAPFHLFFTRSLMIYLGSIHWQIKASRLRTFFSVGVACEEVA